MLKSTNLTRNQFQLIRLVTGGLVGLLCLALLSPGRADETCRVAFDMGSSGIRGGASNSARATPVDIDFLAPLAAGRGLEETLEPTLKALRGGDFSPDCRRVGGGFSAWRLALQQDKAALLAMLAHLHAASGVAVLVIPQRQEGVYGYVAAHQRLGDRLTSSHILDIGGGSLQIAGARDSFGEALGQKIWHRQLCQAIRHSSAFPCVLQPMNANELTAARALLAEKLRDLPRSLSLPVSMTAISRPVSRGVLPAVQYFGGKDGKRLTNALTSAGLALTLKRVARLHLDETAARVGSSPTYVSFLLSDLLLVDGLMRATGSDVLNVTEIDIDNLPGLLADERAYAWEGRYTCYLQRLSTVGLDAYASDPATCP